MLSILARLLSNSNRVMHLTTKKIIAIDFEPSKGIHLYFECKEQSWLSTKR